jgi:hypothetical protein
VPTVPKIKVNAPVLYARNVSPGVDHQWVGWAYTILFTDDLGSNPTHWKPYHDSSVVKARATDTTPAALSQRTFAFTSSSRDHTGYRVVIHMTWYAPTSTHTAGSAGATVRNYLISAKDLTPYLSSLPSCGTTTG